MPKIELVENPHYDMVLHVCQNMRARDHEEIFATRWDDDVTAFANDVYAHHNGMCWAAILDGVPVALVGASPRWPGIWSAWAWGTDDWPKVVRTLTRHVRRVMVPSLEAAGAIRVDALAMEDHADARRWLTALGATPETPLARWGKDGQTFVCYVWSRKHQ